MAQQRQHSASSFSGFFAAFQSASARNDAPAVAAMTQLPFLFDSQWRDQKGFVQIFPQLFDQRNRHCLRRAQAIREDERYVIYCGQYIFYFGKAGTEYKLLEFAVDAEAVP